MKRTSLVLAAMLLAGVGAKAQMVSLDNLNVMYAGIDNPVTVGCVDEGIKGFPLVVDPSEGVVLKGEGNYIVRPNGGVKMLHLNVKKLVTVVGEEDEYGEREVKVDTILVPFTYRVRPIPDPVLKMNGHITGETINRQEFTEGTKLVAMKDPNFEFRVDPASIRVVSMVVSINDKSYSTTSGVFTPEILAAIKRAVKGDRLIIDATVTIPAAEPVKVSFFATLK